MVHRLIRSVRSDLCSYCAAQHKSPQCEVLEVDSFKRREGVKRMVLLRHSFNGHSTLAGGPSCPRFIATEVFLQKRPEKNTVISR
jgi:hypothetical protein